MRFDKRFIILSIFILLSTSAYAESGFKRHLTLEEIDRLRSAKELLGSVDTKSLADTIRELESSRHPQINLQMKEAMAKAYTDIVKEINVQGEQKKEWLYSMVCLNMAYLQFGGTQGKYGSTTELNRLIRQKLKEYLPSNFLNQPGTVYSLE